MNKLSQLASAALERTSDEPYLHFEGRWYSWNENKALAEKLTDLIQASGGGADGPIVFIARSRGAAIGAFLALIRTGRTIRMVYPFQSPAGIVRDIEMMEPSIVVATEREFSDEVLVGIRARGAAAISITEMDAAFVPGLESSSAPLPANPPTEPQIEILTSGTTGKPKPFAVKHEMLGTYFTGQTMAMFGKDNKAVEPPPALLYYPLGNISGLFGIVPALLNGMKLIVIDRFTVKDWHDYIVTYRPASNGTPAAAVQMILDADIPKEDMASIKYFSTGAAPLDPRVQKAFEERYDIPVLLSYGATEFGGPVSAMSPDLYAEFGKTKFGSVGKPFGGAEIRIVDPETKAVLGPNEEGLLQVISPKMGPEWIQTSDVGVLDEDGFLFLRGRADGAIMRGGFKIVPETIQEALMGHPAISAVSAVGVSDRRLGQVPAVAYELKPGAAAPTTEELEAFVRQHVLATYVPVYWKCVDELPKTVSHKVDRPAVIALFADDVAANA